MLLHWGEFYKSVYALPATDRPDDDTVRNDFELDRWYESYTRQRAHGRPNRAIPVAAGRRVGTQADIPTFNPNG